MCTVGDVSVRTLCLHMLVLMCMCMCIGMWMWVLYVHVHSLSCVCAYAALAHMLVLMICMRMCTYVLPRHVTDARMCPICVSCMCVCVFVSICMSVCMYVCGHVLAYDGYVLGPCRAERAGSRGPQGSALAAASSALRRLHSLQLFLMRLCWQMPAPPQSLQ